MIYFIASLITKFFPKLDIQRVQRFVFWVVVVLCLAGVLILVIGIRSCFNRPPKPLSEKERQEIHKDIKDKNEQKLRDRLAGYEADEKVIEANTANAQAEKWAAIQESKEKWANANISELQAEFDRRMKEQ